MYIYISIERLLLAVKLSTVYLFYIVYESFTHHLWQDLYYFMLPDGSDPKGYSSLLEQEAPERSYSKLCRFSSVLWEPKARNP